MKEITKAEELILSQKYNKDQIEVLKYAFRRADVDESKLLNPSIGADYMLMYAKLMGEGVDVTTYINNDWHNQGYDEKLLYKIIKQHLANPKFIDQFTNLRFDRTKNIDDVAKMDGLDPMVRKFLMLQNDYYDINGFLNNDLKSFSLEQIGYLFSLYVSGADYSELLNPNLSVEMMKEKYLGSKNEQKVRKMS